MKTNNIKNELSLHNRIERLEEENIKLKEQVNDCVDFIRILEAWFKSEEIDIDNQSIDCGTY